MFRTRTGIPWRDLPERYGPRETSAGSHRRWCIDGTWQRIADRLRIDAASGEELIAGIDSNRRPLVLATSPGQRGDSLMFEPLMGALRLSRSVGRPRTRPDRVLGDKAYSSRANRDHLRHHKLKATVAQPRDQRRHRKRQGRAGGRPPALDRAVATRYGKRAVIFDGTVQVASIRIWLRDLTRSKKQCLALVWVRQDTAVPVYTWRTVTAWELTSQHHTQGP